MVHKQNAASIHSQRRRREITLKKQKGERGDSIRKVGKKLEFLGVTRLVAFRLNIKRNKEKYGEKSSEKDSKESSGSYF